MADIDPTTGRPIIKINQPSVKNTLEIGSDGRPIIQIGPQAAAAAPDGGSFFVSVGSSVTDQSLIDRVRQTNERLSQLNLAESTFTFYGPEGSHLGAPVTGARTIARTPAILLSTHKLPDYGLPGIGSLAYHTSGIQLTDVREDVPSTMRVLKGEGVSGNYPHLLQIQGEMEQTMRSGDQAASNAFFGKSYGSTVFIGAEPLSENPARLTSVVAHEFTHNLTTRAGLHKRAGSFSEILQDLANNRLRDLQKVPAPGVNPGFRYDVGHFFTGSHTPYKMFPNYDVGEVVDFFSTAVGESFVPIALEEGRADSGSGLVTSLLKRNGIATDGDLATGAGFRSSLMSRYGNPLGFARNYGPRLRDDIRDRLTLHPAFKDAPDEIINSTINEILEQGSYRGSIEYLTSVGFSDELMGVARGEFTTEVENLLLSIDPTVSAENPRIRSFMDQFTEAQKRNMRTSMIISPGNWDQDEIVSKTIDYGSIEEIAERLRTRIASGSEEIQAQIKGVQSTMEEARSVFTRATKAAGTAAELAFDAPARSIRSGASASRSLGARAGVMSKKTLGGILDSLRQAMKVTS